MDIGRASPRPTVTQPRATPASAVTIRPLRRSHDAAVRRVFLGTLVLGRPAPLPTSELTRYASLCLDWYLDHPDGSAVVEQDGVVRGYLLLCLDSAAHGHWARRQAVRWAAGAFLRLVTGRLRGPARRFVALRVRDGLAMRRSPAAPFAAHAHVNLDVEVRDAGVGHRLLGLVDDAVAAAGEDGWYGEMNWPADTTPATVGAVGGVVVHRARNRTLSWLAGTPIDRATVARPLPGAG